ncbi:hypothetical protein CIPAW_03G074700 [Carya illinoinensis]|uniref:Uncharacterized protein n=1 Tax=Carya illinoinensis TaxID=32201 RepID=A0A8T1R0X3_CARIL|nr:hypothetical protein CIPAW_03G074700 [Carya illinoinensis]
MKIISQAAIICSSLPFLGCVLGTLFDLLSSSPADSAADPGENASNDVGTASNAAAQRHFRQLQHIRGAS